MVNQLIIKRKKLTNAGKLKPFGFSVTSKLTKDGFLEKKRTFYLNTKSGRKEVGSLNYYIYPKNEKIAYLEKIKTEKDFRRSGIAEVNFLKVLDDLKKKGVETVFLNSLSPVAKKIFEKYGFVEEAPTVFVLNDLQRKKLPYVFPKLKKR